LFSHVDQITTCGTSSCKPVTIWGRSSSWRSSASTTSVEKKWLVVQVTLSKRKIGASDHGRRAEHVHEWSSVDVALRPFASGILFLLTYTASSIVRVVFVRFALLKDSILII
jgi:hypothetical protein